MRGGHEFAEEGGAGTCVSCGPVPGGLTGPTHSSNAAANQPPARSRRAAGHPGGPGSCRELQAGAQRRGTVQAGAAEAFVSLTCHCACSPAPGGLAETRLPGTRERVGVGCARRPGASCAGATTYTSGAWCVEHCGWRSGAARWSGCGVPSRGSRVTYAPLEIGSTRTFWKGMRDAVAMQGLAAEGPAAEKDAKGACLWSTSAAVDAVRSAVRQKARRGEGVSVPLSVPSVVASLPLSGLCQAAAGSASALHSGRAPAASAAAGAALLCGCGPHSRLLQPPSLLLLIPNLHRPQSLVCHQLHVGPVAGQAVVAMVVGWGGARAQSASDASWRQVAAYHRLAHKEEPWHGVLTLIC